MDTEVERFCLERDDNRRLFQQERLILEITELIQARLNEKKIRRADLAKALQVSRGRITQILDGEGNLTLRTIADVFTALGDTVNVSVCPTESIDFSWNVVRYICNKPDREWRITSSLPTLKQSEREITLAG